MVLAPGWRPGVPPYLQELPPLRDELIHGTDAFVGIQQDTYAEFRLGSKLSDELKVNIFQGGCKQPILSLAE
ncbi:hypothetical protein OS242_09050 [Tumebacillus sp. DT12]|uniref:Uncharacterized protein n=1 Tax=Tumebacillus lacus TaxID=2995335 RepID=A0ABT3X3C5_9BACL|nr:hypothetical protein [Tumebacillus lacus]MCX7570111.1 hypothetical protein [Tumebacillus lacus]